LTLNVLLSFAQFEREVIGERIRDKIVASKKKGMWMGGAPPLGYRAQAGKLIIVESEAETVRFIFRRYVAIGAPESVRWIPLTRSASGQNQSKPRYSTRVGSVVRIRLPPAGTRSPSQRRTAARKAGVLDPRKQLGERDSHTYCGPSQVQ
jgi:hypothetical protein